MENLNTAFDVAEKYLDIPRMLDPEGMHRAFFYSARIYLLGSTAAPIVQH